MPDADDPHVRKIQLTGGTTYTVSLPKGWANEQSLDIGDRVRLYPRGDRLLVTEMGGDADGRTVTASAARYEPAELARIVAAAYVAGAETVRIEDSPGREVRAAVRDAVAGLVGVEISEETDREVVARTMLDADDLSPTRTLTQMESMTLTMHEDALDAALAGDAAAGERIADRDDTVDRLFGLVAREFQRSLVDVSVDVADDRLTTFDYYTAARQLERVADHAGKIAGTAAQIDGEPPSDVADDLDRLAGDARDLVHRALAATVEDPRPETLGNVLADADAVVADAEALDRTLYERDLADGYALATVLDSITRTAEYAVNVAEAGLRASLRDGDPDRLA